MAQAFRRRVSSGGAVCEKAAVNHTPTAPTIERTTYQSYEGLISARLDPFFREKKLRLCDVEPKHIRELHQTIFNDGCNANTVIHYHAVVSHGKQQTYDDVNSLFLN